MIFAILLGIVCEDEPIHLDEIHAALHGLTGKLDAEDTASPTRKADAPDNSISYQNTG